MMKNNIRPELASDELVQHDEKQHMPRVGIRQREMVQHDEKQHMPRVGIRRAGST